MVATRANLFLKRLKNAARSGRFAAEIDGLSRLEHGNIVQSTVSTMGNRTLVMEYCERGDLGSFDLTPSRSRIKSLRFFDGGKACEVLTVRYKESRCRHHKIHHSDRPAGQPITAKLLKQMVVAVGLEPVTSCV